MLMTPELYRMIPAKKDAVIFFQSLFAPPGDQCTEINKLGSSLFMEAPGAVYRSVFGTAGDHAFYVNRIEGIPIECFASSRDWVQRHDLSFCKKTIYTEDLGEAVVDDLFRKIKDEHLLRFAYPRMKQYVEDPQGAKIETDGLLLAGLISLLGNETLGIKCADLFILCLHEMTIADSVIAKVARDADIPLYTFSI
jgi:hypothetical protein